MTGGTAVAERTLALLEAVVRDDGHRGLSRIAADLGLPPSTAYRMAALLVRRGWIAPLRRGHYMAGLALADLGRRGDPERLLTAIARAPLRRLAHIVGATTHLGTWAGDMVTYLVKESAPKTRLFTREGGQLEAYCSAIGRVLLAHLEPARRDAYLAAGPFVALTGHSVTDPGRIGALLDRIAEDGFAIDDQEVADGLHCVALPIRDARGRVIAAMSLSICEPAAGMTEPPPEMRRCAEAIATRLLGGR